MNHIKKIAKNTTVLLVSQVISYILAFFYMIYIARYLGADGFGILTFALAFTGIFGIFADMGLNTLTVREVSRDKSLTNKYFSNVLLIKIILSVLTFGIIILSINLLNYPQEAINIVYLIGLSVIITATSGIFNSIFQAHEKMEYQSIGLIINNVLLFIGVLLIIYYSLGILEFALIYLISSIIGFLYIFIVYLLKFPAKIRFNVNFWKPTIKEALPFGLTGISGMIYTYIDSVMLSLIQNNEVVGWYNGAYRLTLILLFIPNVINLAIFPKMAQYYDSNKNSLNLMYQRYFKYMIVLGIPTGFLITILADRIILLILGTGFLQSIVALQILIWTIVFTFAGAAFVQLLQSINKQVIITKISGICVIINIILNLILIPKYSYIGASYATLITEIILVGYVIYSSYKLGYGIEYKLVINDLFKVLLATFVMSLFIWYFKSLNLFLLIVIGVLLYFVILYIIRGMDEIDVSIFKQIINIK
ncbi:flippase [Methanobacterium sp. ACI-7]|uniref:flippase n=1 Tax=unclassified Methanobacterium TaxID=2627676 RepID=UPI0039C13950